MTYMYTRLSSTNMRTSMLVMLAGVVCVNLVFVYSRGVSNQTCLVTSVIGGTAQHVIRDAGVRGHGVRDAGEGMDESEEKGGSVDDVTPGRKPVACFWHGDEHKQGYKIMSKTRMRTILLNSNSPYHVRYNKADKLQVVEDLLKSEILQELGFQIGNPFYSEWDLLLTKYDLYQSIPYPLKSHQRISVVPGMMVLANKEILMKKHLPFMPRSFSIPAEKQIYLNYMSSHPNTTFLRKSNALQGKSANYISTDDIKSSANAFIIQEFITNPILLNGRKLEVAVFAVMTSVNPLRLYIYDADWYCRVSPEPYHPFDIKNRDKYVIQASNYRLPYEFSEFAKYSRYSLTQKDMLLLNLRNKGLDPSRLEEQIRNMTRDTFIAMETDIIAEGQNEWAKYGSIRNFFNLFRADFLIDENMRVYLTEVNSFPGTGVGKRPSLGPMYRRMLRSTFRLVGVTSYSERRLNNQSDAGKVVVDRDLSTFPEDCVQQDCHVNCGKQDCELCGPCLSQEDSAMLADAVREHSQSHDWSRLFPVPFQSQQEATRWLPDKDSEYLALEPKSRWMSRWFWGKCLQNEQWCH